MLATTYRETCTCYNLYLDPKETRSYLTRKLAYNEAFLDGMRNHLATFRAYPPKQAMGLNLRP